MLKQTIIGVMGSGGDGYEELASIAGELIARSGSHLLTGGGTGVMEAVSRAFTATPGRSGLCIGIIKGESTVRTDPEVQGNRRRVRGSANRDPGDPAPLTERRYNPGNVNPYVEIPIYTHLPLSGKQGKELMSRNHINALSADLFVALPGGYGTFSEVMLRLEYGLEVVLFIGDYKIGGYVVDYFVNLPGGWGSRIKSAAHRTELEEIIGSIKTY